MSEEETKSDQQVQESTQPPAAHQSESVEEIKPREPSQLETAKMIAEQLGETEQFPRQQIIQLVRVLGRTQARALLEKTLEIEANGGMLTKNKKQKRTLGGIFFHLAYTTGIPKKGKVLKKLVPRKPGNSNQPAQPAAPPEPPAPPFHWQDRIDVLEELQDEKGVATTAKLMLMGTLEKYTDKGNHTIGILSSEKSPSMPKGLPARPESKTKYVVAIGSKQWKTITEAVSDPDDQLILEGYGQINLQIGAVLVYATSVTSKKLQAARRESQKKEAQPS